MPILPSAIRRGLAPALALPLPALPLTGLAGQRGEASVTVADHVPEAQRDIPTRGGLIERDVRLGGE